MPHHPPIFPTRILKNIPLSSSRPRHTPTFHGIPPKFAKVLATRLSAPTRTHTQTKRENPHPRRACRKILALFFLAQEERPLHCVLFPHLPHHPCVTSSRRPSRVHGDLPGSREEGIADDFLWPFVPFLREKRGRGGGGVGAGRRRG